MNILTPNVNFHIASAFSHDTLILYFYDLLFELTGKCAFSYVSGAIPCTWNSGRVVPNMSEKYVLQCFDEYAKRNIPVFFTFSNYLISEQELGDIQCNALLSKINENHGGVIVASDILAQYIKSRYPNITIEASILRSVSCQTNRSVLFYTMLEKTYDTIVFHPDDIFSENLISNIQNKTKYEILLNEECVRYCNHRKDHDDMICNLYLNNGIIKLEDIIEFESSFCPTKKRSFINANKCVLSITDVRDYIQKGYCNFKIQGRANPPFVFLYDLCYYLLEEHDRRIIYKNIANKFTFCSKKENLKIWKVDI